MKNSILFSIFSLLCWAQVGCTVSGEVVSTATGTSAASAISISTPATTVADSSNVISFPLSGSCQTGDTVTISVSTLSQTVSCISGSWSATINLGSLSDGTYTVTVSTSSSSQSATLTITKNTAGVCTGGPTVFSTNMNARYVIGQANFVANSANRGGSVAANTLDNPIGITVSNGKLYIADGGNNRILVYNSLPTSNGAAADAVIGQSSFTTNGSGTTATSLSGVQSIAVDGTYLSVAEWGNNRVSFWPLANPSSASFFWGQPNATSSTANNGGISASSLSAPAGLSYANGKYYVGDAGNARTLIFNASSISTNQSAINVVGQSNFTSSAVGSGSTGFGNVYSVSSDGSKLLIMDNNADRVMLYNSIPSSNGVPADVTWGGWGVTSTNLANPVGVFISGTKMFVADRNSDRVLVFNSIPTSAAQPADVVLGQADFVSGNHNQCNCATAAANTLWGVHHVYWDGCRLYVTDKQNNRVLVY